VTVLLNGPRQFYSPLLCFAQVSSAIAQNKPIAPVEDLKVLYESAHFSDPFEDPSRS
jgi:hypothetical protein